MNQTTPEEVIATPYNEKELHHHSRSRIGFHVYISMYFYQFKQLDRIDKEEVLIESGIWEDYGEDDRSIDSVLTPRAPKCSDITKAASKKWREYSDTMRQSWDLRANALNALPIPGKFYDLPDQISNQHILESMTIDWAATTKRFRSCLLHGNKRGISLREYAFGNERVILQSQAYLRFHLNYLLKQSLFGVDCSKLTRRELVWKSKKQELVHIASMRRMNELMELKNLTATCYTRENIKYTCCGKVNIEYEDGKNMIGYVIDENDRFFTIQMENNEIKRGARILYDGNAGKYKYTTRITTTTTMNEDFVHITQFWPIRILLSSSGTTTCTINRLKLDNNDDIVIS